MVQFGGASDNIAGETKGRPFTIQVLFKHRPDREALAFRARAKAVIERVGFEFRHRIFAESYGN